MSSMLCPPTTTSSRASHSSSSSSTLSESINSPLAISNRKPRTPRKRPNQTYNEAAVLLSIACPKVFSTKNVTNKNKNKNKNVPSKIPLISGSRQNDNSFFDPPDMFIPENTGFLVRRPITEKPGSGFGSYPVRSPADFDYRNFDSESNSMEFDTESMLDEEIGEGIDSIMGISHSTTENYETKNDYYSNSDSKTCYGYPMGLGFGGNSEFNFGIGMGMRNGIRALRNCDGGNWRSFPTVNVVNISPPVTAKKIPVEKKKKRVEELIKKPELESELELELERNSGEGCKMLLKLNYDDVLKAWSEKGSPLPEEISGSESPAGDIHSKLAKIDLFSENDGLKEVGVVRYKEKKHTRLFSKKIKYHVRKINAERRPKPKGQLVRRPSSPTSEDT